MGRLPVLIATAATVMAVVIVAAAGLVVAPGTLGIFELPAQVRPPIPFECADLSSGR